MSKRQKKKEKARRERAGDRKEERRGKTLSLESMEVIYIKKAYQPLQQNDQNYQVL